MYKEIHLINDIMKEKYLYGSELVGKYGFPKLEPCNIFLPDETVPFNMAKGERNPKKKICHLQCRSGIYFEADRWRIICSKME